MIRTGRAEIHARLRAAEQRLPFDLRAADIAVVYELLHLAHLATNVFPGIPFPQRLGMNEEDERRALGLLRKGGYIALAPQRHIGRKGELLGHVLAAVAEEPWDEG